MKYILLFFVVVYIAVQGTKNLSKAVLGIYSLVLIIPISGTDHIDTITMLKIGGVNVLEVAILLLAVFGVIKIRRIILYKDWTNILAMVLICIYIIGIAMNVDKARCIADAKDYIIPLLLFFCIRVFCSEKIDITLFLDITLKALRINAFIILIGYFIYWIPSGLRERYGFACESLYVFSIPVQLYLGQKKAIARDKIRNIGGAIIQGTLLLIGQTRSLILCLFFVLGCYLFVGLFQRNTVNNFMRKSGLLILAIIFGSIGYNYILNATFLSGWLYRMSELLSTGMRTQSNKIRLALVQYYIPQIIENPFGYGFGTTMSVWEYNTTNSLSLVNGGALGIDNLFITYIYKLGVITGVIYIVIYIISFYRLLQVKKQDLLIVKIALLVLIIPTMLASAQALKNLTVACFFWGVIAAIQTIKVDSNIQSTEKEYIYSDRGLNNA